MPGGGGIGRGSVKVWLEDDNSSAPCSSSSGQGKAEASVGPHPGNAPIKLTFTFPGGETKEVTLRATDPPVTFKWDVVGPGS